MTATLVRVPGAGNLMGAEACQRTLAIFDGRLRYDLQLAFKRMDKVKADKGYEGPVVVCAIYFSPVAGHIPTRAAIKYISNLRDIEVWLAPIAGTRVLVPFRVAGPTPIGPACWRLRNSFRLLQGSVRRPRASRADASALHTCANSTHTTADPSRVNTSSRKSQ